MFARITTYFRSRRFKKRLYTCSMIGLLGMVTYELITFGKPPPFGGRKVETSGYDGYYDD
jgi:hypothetical protein